MPAYFFLSYKNDRLKKMKFNPSLKSYTKINSKCTTDSNVKGTSTKLSEQNMEENLQDLE